jgi:hypothetical protein
MGMFDNIKCQYPLPIAGKLEELDVNWAKEVFQTKDLDNSLANYKISAEGRLIQEVVDEEWILYTKEEIAELKIKPWSIVKEVVEKGRHERDTNYHGIVLFYTSLEYSDSEDIWVEFKATFTNGDLQDVVLLEPYTLKSTKLSNREWQEKRDAEEKKPWHRFKRTVRPFGWRWFFSKLADLCGYTGRKLSSLQFMILKHIL